MNKLNVLGAALVAFSASSVSAAMVDNGFAGNVESNNWGNFSNTASWGAGAAPTAPYNNYSTYFLNSEESQAAFRRIDGTHYPASIGMYSFNGGASTLGVSDTSVLADVETVSLTVRTSLYSDGSWFADGEAPTLSYNGGTVKGVADYVSGITTQSVFVAAMGQYIDYAVQTFQWDLSSVNSITDYGIQWGQLLHTSLTGLQLDASDTFSVSTAVAPVPVPAAVWLFASGVLGMVGLGRNKKKAA